jgi:hypothetical protein
MSPRRFYHIDDNPPDSVVISEVERSATTCPFTLRFKINYNTFFGQNLYVIGSLPELGCWSLSSACRMFHCGCPGSTTNGLFTDHYYNWQVDIVLPAAPAMLSYRYAVIEDRCEPKFEPGPVRIFQFDSAASANFEFNDIWRSSEEPQTLFLKKAFFGPNDNITRLSSPATRAFRCVFVAHSAILARTMRLIVAGSIPELGNWVPGNGLSMKVSATLQETADVDVRSVPFEYKFVALGGNDLTIWEPNENRRATMSKWDDPSIPTTLVVDTWQLSFTQLSFHGAGVFVRLNTTRFRGELFHFGVVRVLAEWAAKVGFAALHLVGLFDCSAMSADTEAFPVSGFAISPVYLDLSEFGFVRKTGAPLIEKMALLREIWKSRRAQFEAKVEEFRAGCPWLEGYEKVCFARSGEQDEAEYGKFVDFVQYLCLAQVKAAVHAARLLHVQIGLDLPFCVCESSAEVTYQPDMFRQGYRLGVPPSSGNPIGTVLKALPYNFERAAQWFAKRLEFFGSIFSMVRLENTVNFFRQWIVPTDRCVRAVFGLFDPSLSLSYGELETWGLWDVDRYTHPSIQGQILMDLFGTDSAQIAAVFFQRRSDGYMHFRPEFPTERAIVDAKLAPAESALRDKHLEALLWLQDEVLLTKVGESEYTPRLQLWLAPTARSSEPSGRPDSYAFKNLPPFHQPPFISVHHEFVVTRQQSLWTANGRQNLSTICGSRQALVFSDASGADGELTAYVLQSLGLLPFRAHLEGRSSQSCFDDIRDYPYLTVAAPIRDLEGSLPELWKTKLLKRKHLWEDELYETGSAPVTYDDRVASALMKLHCWCGSMWVMFPMDALIGASRHLVEVDGKLVLEIQAALEDERAHESMRAILQSSKRIP